MGWALIIAVALTAVSLVHLLTIRVDEQMSQRDADATAPPLVDFGGALSIIRDVPGLSGLIMFAAFNNHVGGVFMSLMDAYGLSLVSVETWGILFAFISFGSVLGGLHVSRKGLGPRSLRSILIGNTINWTVCSLFSLRSSIVMLAVGMLVWMTPMPAIEVAEQTVLQRVVPFDHRECVFGSAQTVENAGQHRSPHCSSARWRSSSRSRS